MAIKGDMEKPCIIYLATNKVTGKRYIGVTAQKYLSTRISQHFAGARRKVNKGAFHRALRKYGRDGFEWVVIEQCESVSAGLIREIALIAAMKPEYNSTLGGDGARGHRMSASSRKKMSDFHKGKAWHLGMPHSEETKIRLRELGIANKAAWSTFAAMGPAASAKRVVCLDDGIIYESISAAARAYGVGSDMICNVCKKRRATAAGGRVFRYEGEHEGGALEANMVRLSRTRTSDKRPVICLNDNMLFDTKSLAANFYGIGTQTVRRSCIDGGKVMTSGLAFNFLDEWCPNPL